MHPRTHNRPHWQRCLSPAELRRDFDQPDEPASVEHRMTDLFVDRMSDGLDTDHYDLTREGFTEAEVIKHAATAAGRADARRQADVSDDRAVYDRNARINLGANAIAGMLLNDTGAVHTALHQVGLLTREIGNLYPDIIGTALRIVRESRPDMAAA